MRLKWLSLTCIYLASLSIANATIYPKSLPCNPSPYGTFCDINAKVKPSRKYKYYAYCGDTVVAISKKQRDVLSDYLKENVFTILDKMKDRRFIFNVGHGLTPDCKIDNVKKVISVVRNYHRKV